MTIKSKVYLAGSMEFASDNGKTWRAEAEKLLIEKGLQPYDPCIGEQDIFHAFGLNDAKQLRALKTKDFEKYKKCMRQIQKRDLAQIASSDFILLYVDDTLANKPSGTIGEVTCATHIYNVPIIAIWATKNNDQVSGWLQACIDKRFTTVDEAVNFISKVAESGDLFTG